MGIFRPSPVLLLLAGCFAAWPQRSLVIAELTPATASAFDSYVRQAEQHQTNRSSFLWADRVDRGRERLQNGEILVAAATGKGEIAVEDGLIHHWVGAVFVPGTTLAQTMATVRGYGRHATIYPEVAASKVLRQDGNSYRIYLRLVKKKIVTVVLNTEHDVLYSPVDATRWKSRSYSTRIAEVEGPGTPRERELPEGKDHGFLWRLYSYWRFEEGDGGVYIECEAISLTRDVPTGLGWLVQPIVRSLPRESLTATLKATRGALEAIRR